MVRSIKFKNIFVKIVKAEGDFKTSKNYFVLSRVCQQFRLSIVFRRNNTKSSQLKIKCDDVLVYNLFVNVSHCVLKDFVGWEKWLTRQLEKPGWRIKFLKGFFQNLLAVLTSSPFLSSCFFLSLYLSFCNCNFFLSLSLSSCFFLSLCLSFCNCNCFSLSRDLSTLLSTRRRTIVQSTLALCSICLVAKCLPLSIGLNLSKPVDRRDESFQTDSVCPRVSFALPEGKQNSVAPFRCWFET